MLLVGKVILCRRHGVRGRIATASVAYEQVLFLLSGAVTALALSASAQLEWVDRHRPVVVATCLLALVALHPAIVRAAISTLQRWSGDRTWIEPVGAGRIAALLCAYLVPWMLSGIAFYVFATAFVPLDLRAAPDFIALFALATILGFVSLFAPAGLGVRDAALAVLLSAYVPAPVALAISLAVRVAVTVVDLASIGAALLLGPRSRRLASDRAARSREIGGQGSAAISGDDRIR